MEQFAILHENVVVGEDESAFAGGQRLGRLAGERPDVADRPHLLAAPLAAVGVGGVLDQEEVVLVGDLADLVEIDRIPAEVDADDTDGFLRDLRSNRVGVDVGGLRFHVDEFGDRTRARDGAGGRDERVGGNEHFVAGLDAARSQGEFERDRPVRDGDRVFGVVVLGELRLDSIDVVGVALESAPRAGVDAVGDVFETLLVDLGPVGDIEIGGRRRAAANG